MLVPIKSLYPFFGLTLSPDKVCKRGWLYSELPQQQKPKQRKLSHQENRILSFMVISLNKNSRNSKKPRNSEEKWMPPIFTLLRMFTVYQKQTHLLIFLQIRLVSIFVRSKPFVHLQTGCNVKTNIHSAIFITISTSFEHISKN